MLDQFFGPYTLGSNYGYAWHIAIQIKRSVCHSKTNGMDLAA